MNITNLPSLRDPSLLRTRCLIGESWCDADDGRVFAVHDPATGLHLADVPDLGAAETRRAIEAARAALPGWRSCSARQRSVLLRALYDLIVRNADDLAALLTAEQGKPLAEARGEILYGAAFVEWFAEEARRAYGDVIPAPAPDRRILVLKQPVGVCAAITPWNFPSAMVTRKLAPALAAGCTVVLKPAEQTPLSALALGELVLRAGIPPGVVNVVTGEPVAIGQELTSNPVVRKLSFTGSSEVGRLLMAQSAGTLKRLSLELGGNAPFLVFDDADLDAAAAGALASKYRNAGQTCVSANRILVQDAVYEAFASKLAERTEKLVVGAGTEPGVGIGPLIDQAALDKVRAHVDDAVARGARVVLGGRAHARGGLFFEPTLLTEVTGEMRVAREETFGPVAPLFRFRDEAEALALANATEHGLAAYLYSRDLGRVFRITEGLEHGMVGVNTATISSEVAPFGGVKQSGFGREGSKYGLDDYLDLKYVCLAGL
jgi:succinate-semialdehyde dehydrogenase/glutarate-semialdehyde dehydrogenase